MGKKWKQWQALFSWAPKPLQMVTETIKLKKKNIAPWKKSYDKPRQYNKKQRHTLPTIVHVVKAVLFPVVMYGCESWTIRKAKLWRIDVLELFCWRRHLRVPWAATRSNQSILKEVNPEYSLERLMLKVDTTILWPLMRKANTLKRPWYWERLKAGREGDKRGWDGCMASLIL